VEEDSQQQDPTDSTVDNECIVSVHVVVAVWTDSDTDSDKDEDADVDVEKELCFFLAAGEDRTPIVPGIDWL